MDTALTSNVEEAVRAIHRRTAESPKLAVVLGSGLGEFGDSLTGQTAIHTNEIPYYPISSVPGHAGKLVFGAVPGTENPAKRVLAFQGRIHFYECDSLQTVVFPILVAARLGIEVIVLTNAAGGINKEFNPGDLMLIRDYINLTFENPLRGLVTAAALNRNPVVDPELLNHARSVAVRDKIPFKEGVYCWTKGPSYESAAEIRMMAGMGADAVGMSTVPEMIVAANFGMRVLGISCVTNLATGMSGDRLNHQEVTDVAQKVKANFTGLITAILSSV
jgi:purine-nucleoside phosphorylase